MRYVCTYAVRAYPSSIGDLSTTHKKEGIEIHIHLGSWMRVWCYIDKLETIQYSPMYWVNLSKRGGNDGVFLGLAGLHRGISRGQSPREIPRSSPRKTPSFRTLLLRYTFYFQHDFSKYWGQQASRFFGTLFQLTSDDKMQILTQLSFHEIFVQSIFVNNDFVLGPLWKFVKKKSSKRLW